jgi:hypothetical protein
MWSETMNCHQALVIGAAQTNSCLGRKPAIAAKQQPKSLSRAAGVSPPWCVARTVADENRTMLAGSRTRNQERRDVSPPWFGNANAGRRESSNVRGLANTQSRAAGVSPPWGVRRMAPDENPTMLAGSRTHNQERRASARRGVWRERLRMKIQQCSLAVERTIKSGGREPAVAV